MSHAFNTGNAPSPDGDSQLTPQATWNEKSFFTIRQSPDTESLSWCCHFWNKNCFSSVLGVLYRLWSSHWLQNPTTKRQVSCIDNGISSTVSMYFPNAPVSSFCYLFFLMPPQCFYLFLVVLLKKQKLCSKCHNTIYFFPGFYCIESLLCLGRSALLCPFRLQW